MATEILRPNAVGDECNIKYDTGCSAPSHWRCVDEDVPDSSTYLSSGSSSYQRDLYNLPASTGSGVIFKITLYFRVKMNENGGCVKGAIKSNSTIAQTAEKDPYTDFGSNTYGTYSWEWTTNPADGQAWEWADIDTLQIGIALKKLGTNYSRCTQVYVEVDYGEPTNVTINPPSASGSGEGLVPTIIVPIHITISATAATAQAEAFAPSLSCDMVLFIPLAQANAEVLVPEINWFIEFTRILRIHTSVSVGQDLNITLTLKKPLTITNSLSRGLKITTSLKGG